MVSCANSTREMKVTLQEFLDTGAQCTVKYKYSDEKLKVSISKLGTYGDAAVESSQVKNVSKQEFIKES